MLKALPSRLLDIVGGGPGMGGAAQTRPLAGGPATEPVTPILLGDLRTLPGNGQSSNLPLGPAVQPTPPVWPAPNAPTQAPPAQPLPPVQQQPWPAPQQPWPQQPWPQQPAPQPPVQRRPWPQQPVPQPPVQQQPWPQQPVPQPPVQQQPWPGQPVPQFPMPQPQQNQCRCAGCCQGGNCCAPRDGALGTAGVGNPASGIAQVFGAIASVGQTIWGGIKSIIDAFRGKKKRPQNPPNPFPAPTPPPGPFAAGGPAGTGANPQPAQAARPPVDPRVVEAVAEANRTLATVAQTLEKLSARRATVRAGGPGQIVQFPRAAEAAPAPAPPPAPAPVPAPLANPANPPVLDDKQQALAAIMAQLLGLLTTLTKLLEKLVPEQGAVPG